MVASGRPVSEIAQALGIGDNLIYRWKNAASGGVNKGGGLTNAMPHSDAFTEIERFKAELRRTERKIHALCPHFCPVLPGQ